MILEERAKKCSVQAVRLDCVDTIHEVADATTCRLECLCDPEVPVFLSAIRNDL